MSVLQKLLFAIGVSDEASGKMLGIQRAVDKTCSTAKSGFGGVRSALGAALSVGALSGIISPAKAFGKALKEVEALGTDKDSLAGLQKSAKHFVINFGGDAAEVVRSAKGIQRAFKGLKGTELGSLTETSSILARATQEDTAAVSTYMGTMYGVFQKQADKMGRIQWAERMAGRTAWASQKFNTTGADMSAAFGALGTTGQTRGVTEQEQMAVLGMLQQTKGGGEAGAMYKAFLSGAGRAQEKLGLKLTDKKGNLLGMDQILAKIRAKFGDNLSVKALNQLKKGFRSEEAVALITTLMGKTDELKQNIADIGNINNMDKAREMAAGLSGAWGRLSGAWQAVRISFGQGLLPTVTKVVGKLADFLSYIHKCMDIAPGLTSKLAHLVGILTIVGSVMGLVGAAFAFGKVILAGFLIAGGPLIGLLGKLKTLFAIIKAAVWVFAFSGTYLTMVFKMMTVGALKFAAALLANPITWIVLGIMALVAGVVALIYYWSDLVAWFENTSWGQGLIATFQELRAWWNDLTAAFTDGTWVQTLMGLLDSLMAPLRSLGNGVVWIGEKLGIISDESPRVEASGVAALASPRQSDVLPGAVAGQISNATNNSGKTVTVGTINIQSAQVPTLEEMEEMCYGA